MNRKSKNAYVGSGRSTFVLAVQAFFKLIQSVAPTLWRSGAGAGQVVQMKFDPTSLAFESIQTGSVRALRSIMGETARHLSDR